MRTTSGHLILQDFTMPNEKKQHQPPLSVEQQILNLKELGLVIEDEDSARKLLNDVSYFRLIKAYSLTLKPKNGNYANGTTFNQIRELYLFNANFRQQLFPLIEKIEINLRCRIANYFCEKYGVFGHREERNFKNAEYHNEFMHDLANEEDRNAQSPFVKNFRQNYEPDDLPLYAVVELLSFGTLSKFFKNMKNEDKKAIAKTFGVGYTYFESWIESIANVRNLCAHYGRLYNAKLTKTPKLYDQYSSLGIKNNRIFAILLCMHHVLESDTLWVCFVDILEALFEKYPHVRKNCMGFPNDWKILLQA